MTYPGPPQEPFSQDPNLQQTGNPQPPYPHPGSGYLPRPAPPAKAFAVLALVFGIVAFLTGAVPVMGLLLGITAVTFGTIALVKQQPKGLSITGLSLGGVALLVGLGSTMLLGSLATSGTSSPSAESQPQVSETEEDLEKVEVEELAEAAALDKEAADKKAADKKAADKKAADKKAADKKTPEKKTPEKKVAEVGTIERPQAQPYVAEGIFGGEKYSLTGTIIDANASALVASWNMFNSEAPSGFKYVVVELTMTGIDTDGVEPSIANYDLYLATGEGNRYSNEFVMFGDGMPTMTDGPTLYPGSSFTGYTAYIVPDTADAFLLYDNGTYVSF